MNLVEIRAINVDNPIWMRELESFCLGVLKELGKSRWNVSVVLCDDSFVRELNGTYRGIYEPTDVLSFAQDTEIQSEDLHLAGDVIVSLETMKRNAHDLNTSEKDELKRLLVHGILHLAGMDHEEDATGGCMLDLQESILKNDQENRAIRNLPGRFRIACGRMPKSVIFAAIHRLLPAISQKMCRLIKRRIHF